MSRDVVSRKTGRMWLRLLPYIMLLLPLAVLNLGFRFFAIIEQHWKERVQSEVALQELEALTRSSSFEYRLNRAGGQLADRIEAALRQSGWQAAGTETDKDRLLKKIGEAGNASLNALSPGYKLHIFRKTSVNAGAELFFTKSDRVESKRAMAMIFDYMVDQHRDKPLTSEIKKQRDKLAENYFGRTARSEAFARGQKGRSSNILHDGKPHWFFWDYLEIRGHGLWGWFIAARNDENSREAAQKLALAECRQRGGGLAGFVPVVGMSEAAVLCAELENSRLFKDWCSSQIRPLDKNLAHWLSVGPPEPAQLGRYRIYSYLGKDTRYLTVFLAPVPDTRALPAWIRLINMAATTLCLLLSLRGLLLGRWLETGLTLRFVLLYFLAATFPLGMLAVTAAAYHYQSSRSAQNQIAENLEGCLRQIETRKMQIQEEYQSAARQAFADTRLAELIDELGVRADAVKDRIVERFHERETALPLLGFYLLDTSGEGTQYSEEASAARLKDIFSVYRAPIIQNLRRRFALEHPEIKLPEFKITEEETFGAQAFRSVTGNTFNVEIEKRRNFCINQQAGEGTATLIYDFIQIRGVSRAMLFLVWDIATLFEKSLQTAIESFKGNFPGYSFIAFRNTPQGLKNLYRPDDVLANQLFSGALRVAETAAARGGTVTEHLTGFSVVAMPYGQNSEIVIAGISSHQQIGAEESNRRRIFILLILVSLAIAALCAYFTAAFLLKPMGDLKSALDRVAMGDYTARLDSERADELGNLTREFAQMIEGVKERERLAALLSDHAVEALAKNTGTEAECDARAFKGIALVSDIRNFTTLCETVPTDEITEMLNHHFAAMSEVISANGGRIYKFIGDAIEAVFDEDDEKATAARAAKTAVEMHATLSSINSDRKKNGKFTYAFGVGLARGRFYAGSVGSEDTRLDYSIIGEAFHKAAQLEALTKKLTGMPVAFDLEIASLLIDVAATCTVASEDIGGYTFKTTDEFSATASAQFASAQSAKHDIKHNTAATVAGSDEAGSFQKNYQQLSVVLFAILMIFTASGIYQGFAIGNQSQARFSRNQAAAKIYRLIRQIKAEDAGKVAFESKMDQLLKDTESELQFTYDPSDDKIIGEKAEQVAAELLGLGIESRHIFATTGLASDTTRPPRIALAKGVDNSQRDFYHKLAHFQLLYFYDLPRDEQEKLVNPRMGELFGTEISADHFTAEKIGGSMPVETGTRRELFYWNYLRVFSEKALEQPLPANNHRLSGMSPEDRRIAGIVMFSIDQAQAQGNPQLLVNAYSEPGFEIALRSDSGQMFHRASFPMRLLTAEKPENAADYADYLVELDEIRLNQQNYRLIIVSNLPAEGSANLRQIAVLLLLIIVPVIIYFYHSIYAGTVVSKSIQSKLVFSILLTALVPMLTVVFISNYFIFENHQAMVQQQRLEIKRFLDAFETTQYFIHSGVTWQIQEMSKNPHLLELARELEQRPGSEDIKSQLRNLLTDCFKVIDADGDWSSNVTARNCILLGQNKLEFHYGKTADQEQGEFANVLSQIGRHILACISNGGGSGNLSMKNLKSELYFDGAMQSLRSNFGDRSYIRLSNAISQLVEFEITTGAAGVVIMPLPSLENPEFVILWLISFSRGNYMTRIAEHNRGPVAILSIEYHRYGKLMRKFMPVPGLDLFKETAWIAASNMPVSSEKKIRQAKISVEGRPGIQQFNSLVIGAASQTPIDRITGSIREYLHYFMALAVLLFVLIGYQTASDIMLPVRALTDGMHQISLQNYFYRIRLDRSDELGQLCASYDRFAKGLAEKEVMGKMLSRSARRAMAGSADASDMLISSKREYILIFIGSIDFATRLSGGNAEELFKQLKNQVAQLCRIIIDQGGDIDKLMGDKILGVFATSSGTGQSARQAAINSTRMIIKAEQAGELHFPVAIGVNAGEVISGMLGFGAKRDFTVIGDAVNVSARIAKEAENLPGQRCLFSQDFVSSLADAENFELHSEVCLKGKSTSLKLYSRSSGT